MMKKNRPWWKAENIGEGYLSLVPTFNFIRSSQMSRLNNYLSYARLYSNRDFLSFNSDQYTFDRVRDNKMTFNIVQSVVDTISAKISKNKVRPMFLTKGGDYYQKRKAQRLQKFVDGLFYENQAYTVQQAAFKDGAIFGNGYIKHFDLAGRPRLERRFPANLYVDSYEAKYSTPRNLYEHAEIDRDCLLSLFKDKASRDIIERATPIPYRGPHAESLELIGVHEAWHLPSFKDAGDGKHIICLDSGDLTLEKWEFTDFPFSSFKWNTPLIGYYAQGLADILMFRQFEISYTLKRIQRAIHRMTTPYIFVNQGTKFDTSQLTNEIGAIIKYVGEKPTGSILASVAPEMLNHLQWLIDKSYEEVGLSQLSAGSQLPPGLESRVAIREYNDIESERFNLVGQNYENLALDMARKQIQLARYIFKNTGEMKVLVESGDKDLIEEDWANIDLDDDQFTMQIWPTSLLPQSPSGQLDTVDKMIVSGLIDVKTGRKLLNFPDTESAITRLNAPGELIDKIISDILEKGESMQPEPYMDLDLAIKEVGNAYLLAKKQNVEEYKLELFREFIEACYDLQKPPEQPPMPTTDPNAAVMPTAMDPSMMGGMPPEQMMPPAMPVGAPMGV